MLAGLVLTVFTVTAHGQPARPDDALVRRLAAGEAIFGIFSGDKTAEQGASIAGNRELDFVFYSLERGPFDLPQMQTYMEGMAGAATGGAQPIPVRIPPSASPKASG